MIEKEADELDVIFTALASSHRRRIVYFLSFKPHPIKQLADKLELSLPAIHRHIKVLEDSKLVQRKKNGRVNFLAIKRENLQFMQKWILQFNSSWGSDEESLENYVARIKKDEKY